MSVCQGDLIALDIAISTITGVPVTSFSVMFTVMSTLVSDRLNTPISPPTKAYEASDVHVYSCHSLGLEYPQLCCDRLVEKLKENTHPVLGTNPQELLHLMPCYHFSQKKSNTQYNSDHS